MTSINYSFKTKEDMDKFYKEVLLSTQDNEDRIKLAPQYNVKRITINP